MSMNNPRNILVTGGCGFMGSCFIRYLLQETSFAGKIVNVDALTYASFTKNLSCVASSSRYLFFQANITNIPLLETIVLEQEIDLIVHFAAETHVDRSIAFPDVFIESNIRGSFCLLELVRKFPYIHFHQVSTDEVFGSLGEEGMFQEHSAYRPNSPYAATKAAADHLVRSYTNTYGLSTTISHAVNNFGPYQYPEKLIPKMMQCFQNKQPIGLYGSGVQKRSWIFVEDHAHALWILLQKGRSQQTYNIPGTASFTNIQIVEQYVDLLRSKGAYPSCLLEPIVFIKERPGHDFHYALDGTKLQKLGYKPRVSFTQGLEKTFRWYKKQLSNKASLRQ